MSCFDCHTAVDHPGTWADPLQHGRQGAQLAVNTDPKVMAGLAHCQRCHGSDYTGGISKVSCKSCHTKAPHPAKPWVSTTLTKSTHVETDVSNAVACAACHTAGANSDMKPKITPTDPLGTSPGCFNNTLCHGTNIARPVKGGAISGTLN